MPARVELIARAAPALFSERALAKLAAAYDRPAVSGLPLIVSRP
jgi:hypothetical protein